MIGAWHKSLSHFIRAVICSKGSLRNQHDYKKMTSPFWIIGWKQNWVLVDFHKKHQMAGSLLILQLTCTNGRHHHITTCGCWTAKQLYCTLRYFFHFKFFRVVYTVSSSNTWTSPLRAGLHHCLYSFKGLGIFLKLFLHKAFAAAIAAAASRKLSCSNNKILAHQLNHTAYSIASFLALLCCLVWFFIVVHKVYWSCNPGWSRTM